MKTVLPVYSIIVGIAMIVMWIVLWEVDQIPEMMTRPWEIAMHLTAEFTTAALLVISGFGMLAGYRWADRINIFASGMLAYTLIQSPGYYLQHNATILVLISAVFFLITAVLSPAFKPQPQKL
jgi:hypothetical protein